MTYQLCTTHWTQTKSKGQDSYCLNHNQYMISSTAFYACNQDS